MTTEHNAMKGIKQIVYLAASFSKIEDMKRHAEQLKSIGYSVSSRWILGGHRMTDESSPTEKHRLACEDLDDIDVADIVVVFPAWDSHRGGVHVEFGYALARRKRLIVIGARTNVFHWLANASSWHASWDSWFEEESKNVAARK